jgi:hypothetical protein
MTEVEGKISDTDRQLWKQVHFLASLRQAVFAQLLFDLAVEDGNPDVIRFIRAYHISCTSILKQMPDAEKHFDLAMKQPGIEKDRAMLRDLLTKLDEQVTIAEKEAKQET